MVRAGGFSAAARELDLPTSAVSRRVKRLETRLGVPLLFRTTRRVGLTAQGRAYYEHIARVPQLLDEAERAALDMADAPKGVLRLATPPEDGGVIWSTIRSFMKQHPDVDLEITHSLDRVDLISSEFDVALRGGTPPDSPDVCAKLIWDTRMFLAASPAYLELHGTPARVEELSEHIGVCMDGWAPNALRSVSGERGPVRVHLRNRIRANSLETAKNACLDGLGIAPLMKLTCEVELESGALVEVLKGALPMSAKGWLLYPLSKKRTAAATAFIEHILDSSRARAAQPEVSA